jgi:hypothetical protein
VQAQPLDQRIGARPRHARVEDLDHHVDLRHGLGRFLARRIHVAGEPVNTH